MKRAGGRQKIKRKEPAESFTIVGYLPLQYSLENSAWTRPNGLVTRGGERFRGNNNRVYDYRIGNNLRVQSTGSTSSPTLPDT